MQTLRDIKEQLERDQARIKRRGHNGLTVEDLQSIARMREIGERQQLERERKRRLGIVDYYVPPPGKKYR